MLTIVFVRDNEREIPGISSPRYVRIPVRHISSGNKRIQIRVIYNDNTNLLPVRIERTFT